MWSGRTRLWRTVIVSWSADKTVRPVPLPAATVRTPGGDIPFAMAIGAEAPIYLGLALD